MKLTFKHIQKLFPMFFQLFKYDPFFKKCVKDDKQEKYSFSFRNTVYRKEILRLNKKYFNMVIFSSGIEKSKDQQVLFTPNHQAYTDAVSLLYSCDRAIGFVAKKETKSFPKVLKRGMTTIGNIPLDRSDLRSELLSFKKISDLLENNPDLSYVIFPEGTRSLPPKFDLGPIHPGSFRLATKIGIPIVPVCLYGGERFLNPKFKLKKYPVQVRYLDPIYPEEYDNMTPSELADKIKNELEKNLVELKELDLKYLKLLNNFNDEKMEKIKKIYDVSDNVKY